MSTIKKWFTTPFSICWVSYTGQGLSFFGTLQQKLVIGNYALMLAAVRI
jgi:hypothetical protein